MNKYPINEIFTSIQGEGVLTGTPMTFIRLQGCDIGCAWCDTKESWEIGNDTLYYATQEILEKCDMRWACITGGEPAKYDLTELTYSLGELGKKIAIETSGCYPIRGIFDWITISPKFNSKKTYYDGNTIFANELKFPIGKESDIDKVLNFIKTQKFKKNTAIILQPISQSQSATQLCIDAVKKYQWRLSLQTHKFIKIQ